MVLAIFVLAGIFGNTQQPTSTPTSDTLTSTSTAPVLATTTVPAVVAPVATTTAPVTTTVAPVTTTVAPVRTTTRVTRAAVVAPPRRTTVHHVAPKPKPKPAPKPTKTVPPAPAPGRYHAGEFCSTLGAHAISSNGKAITCIQEGSYKRWHND